MIGKSTAYTTNSPGQTKKLAELLAKEILEAPKRKGAFVLALRGDLGGGKTTFLQGFAKGLKIKQKITSPTFVLMKKYKIPNTRYKIQNFYHLDCYRIEKSKDILDLGLKEIISNPQNIAAVEWAEKISKVLPKNVIWLSFEFIGKNSRKILVSPKLKV
ncbi:MAG: tRNA (adenosine(37)-N6)-threonylcarbamoyltransferase complex ATPase subunit type 1 TsaE [bacterium]